ncbi:Uma2 family endonuclease [Actinocorallia herbida]|uniref:Uma2 family endonuclease n=1 Tax=Actinocorallia herbida TaxID=58109 RepID=A0A3N1D6A8_9ACTN|nr:Uma2 family endonuclease [Actinocorallia herbida]ROO88999.1 Uma2 family endonuclease [Actinocorallia herbida]
MRLPVWATDPASMLITEEQYEALPADIARTIEVVDGRVIFCQSPTPEHRTVSFNLTAALKGARPKGPCVAVLQDTDMWYVYANVRKSAEGKHFTLRRPDVSVLWCLKPRARMTSADVFVAIEISSTNTETDFADKKAEYARQGIEVYLIVVMAESRIHSVEEYRLDWSKRNYQLAAVHREALRTSLPEGMLIDVSFTELELN